MRLAGLLWGPFLATFCTSSRRCPLTSRLPVKAILGKRITGQGKCRSHTCKIPPLHLAEAGITELDDGVSVVRLTLTLLSLPPWWNCFRHTGRPATASLSKAATGTSACKERTCMIPPLQTEGEGSTEYTDPAQSWMAGLPMLCSAH